MEIIMSLENRTTMVDHAQYDISQSGTDLLFTWKHIEGLSVDDMANGITEFANQCKAIKPGRAVIDARQLDPNCAALAWVSGQKIDENQGEYNAWWLREIVPLYNAAGISGLAVATGNSQAPGELPQVPAGVEFNMGYFNGFDDAMIWTIE